MTLAISVTPFTILPNRGKAANSGLIKKVIIYRIIILDF